MGCRGSLYGGYVWTEEHILGLRIELTGRRDQRHGHVMVKEQSSWECRGTEKGAGSSGNIWVNSNTNSLKLLYTSKTGCHTENKLQQLKGFPDIPASPSTQPCVAQVKTQPSIWMKRTLDISDKAAWFFSLKVASYKSTKNTTLPYSNSPALQNTFLTPHDHRGSDGGKPVTYCKWLGILLPWLSTNTNMSK